MGLKTPWFLFSTPDVFSDIALKTGYDGIEYFPHRFRSSNVDGLHPVYLQLILSAHQTWRSEVYVWDIWCKLAAFAFITVPERRSSMSTMLRLQNALDNIGIDNIPITIYPFHHGLIGNKVWTEGQYPEYWDLHERVVQTAPDLLRMWNIRTAQEFADTAKSMGFTGLVFDTKHIREFSQPLKNGDVLGFGDWKYAFHDLLPYIKVIHIQPLNREELAELVFHQRGELADILATIRESGWHGLVVIEVSFDKMMFLIPKGTWFVSKEQFVGFHRQLLKSIKKVLESNDD